MFKPTLFSICILLPLAIAQAPSQCMTGNNGFACPDENCRTGTPLEINGEKLKCCTVLNPVEFEPKCQVDERFLVDSSPSGVSRGLGKDGLDGPNKDYDKDPIEKPSKDEMKIKANAVLKALDGVVEIAELGDVSNKINKDEFVSRSSVFNFGPFGIGGSFGGGLFGGGARFPKCPVHVKMCYRVSCGGGRNGRFLDANPRQCLSDPRCCYDYKLAFMRRISPRFFGDTPVCYYGPTSKQWLYLTNFFKPWNPWYTGYILKVFKELFNTNAFNIGGKFICEIDFQKKAYPVGAKSKLQCNLVSGCWDGSLPKGSKCFMPGSIAQQFLGQKNVYPSLFTDDPSKTQCSADWFIFGPKAYDRLPCGIGPPPDSIWDMLYDWCPSTDCCINYAGLGVDKTAGLSALGMMVGQGDRHGFPALPEEGISGFPALPGMSGFPALPGMSGFPAGLPGLSGGGQTQFDPMIFAYLLGNKKTDLSKLYCPYRKFFSSSLFPDFKDDIKGCCDIPLCYHKKKYVGGGFPTYPPPTRPPPQGVWGAWSSCNAQCGRYDTRTRVCLLHGQPTSSHYCVGSSSEQCLGYCPPTPPPAVWGAWSSCNAQCGSYDTRTRVCLLHGQPTSPHYCVGSSSEQCSGYCPPTPPPEAVWGAWSSCNAQCGRYGTRTRVCLLHGQSTSSHYCVGPSSEQCSGYCPATPSPALHRWGPWRKASRCSESCGEGSARYQKDCFRGSQPANPNLCQGGASQQYKTDRCNEGPCPISNIWGQWQQASSCSRTCGEGSASFQRSCFSGSQQVDPSDCPGGASQQHKSDRCNDGVCWTPPPASYTWSEERLLQACSVTCGTGFEIWGRQCLGPASQVVADSFCLGTSHRQKKSCYRHPCPKRPQWAWVVSAPCGATCGDRGVRIETRKCKYEDGSDADSSECPPDTQGHRNTNIIQCNAAPCPLEHYWSGWRADCIVTNGQYCVNQNFVRQYKSCFEKRGNNFVLVNPQSLCGLPSLLERQVPCSPQVCNNS